VIEKAPPRTLVDRVERYVARFLLGLPHPVQLRLSGKPQIVIDGQPLHPEMQLALSARTRRGVPPLRAESAELGRARMLAETRRYVSDPIPLRVRDLIIPLPGRSLDARHYAPDDGGGPHPLLVFFHGGGFALGDIETHDEPCRLLCRDAGVHVLSVAYRLAPEHPFPAGIDDGEAAFRWAVENAASLGADPSRVGVGGDSAGGNIAAVVTASTANKPPSPSFQLLIYPVTDRSAPRPSFESFAEGFLLERADVEWFDRAYIGERVELLRDVRISPLLAAEPPAVPTVVVTGGFDPLRDEGEAYAAWLERHGTPVQFFRFSGLIHGFINMTSVSPAAAEAVRETAALLRRVLNAEGLRSTA
jgi:acetyl esterase